jgi:hypothetical protein
MLKNLAFYFLSLAVVVARGKVEVKITPALRPYCHIIRFPQGWIYPIFATGPSVRPHSYDYNSGSDYEFRASGPVGSKFLISGVNILGEGRFYTNNQYEIDLTDREAVPQPASGEAWQAAKAIPLSRHDLMARSPLREDAPFRFRERAFARSGKWWSLYSSRLSPSQTWLALQSKTEIETYVGEVGSPFGGTGRYKGKLFWDIFNAETGKKVLTITGTYLDTSPDYAIHNAAWLTDRYFIIALGEHRERCLVCEFDQAGVPKP